MFSSRVHTVRSARRVLAQPQACDLLLEGLHSAGRRPIHSRNVATTSSAAVSEPPKRRSSTLTTALAVGFGIAGGYGLALAVPPSWYKLLNPAPVAESIRKDSKEGIAYTKAIEEQLQQLDIVARLRAETLDGSEHTSSNETSLEAAQMSKARRWKEMRPYARVPEERKRHSLTQSTLRGPGMFAVPPLLFTSQDNRECVAIMHLGDRMCGHNGIVHGGLLATILDEAVARPAFFSLPNRIAMTAYLNVRYKAPTYADNFIIVRAKCPKAEGRKAWVVGSIETLEGQPLVEADALYVEPKNAWVLAKSSAVREALADAGE